MNRKILIERIAEKTGEYKKNVEAFIDAYEAVIEQALIDGEDVHLHGFVSFQVKEQNEKTYVNPKTGERRQLAPVKKIRAKVSASLNDKIK